jgi:hypothetical protein
MMKHYFSIISLLGAFPPALKKNVQASPTQVHLKLAAIEEISSLPIT